MTNDDLNILVQRGEGIQIKYKEAPISVPSNMQIAVNFTICISTTKPYFFCLLS